MAELTVYEKPTCHTCRKLADLLTARGIDFESVNYHVEGLTEGELRELLRKSGLEPHELLRMRESRAAEVLDLDDDAMIAQMVAHPELVERPIVVRGERAVLARPVEKVLELL